MTHEQAYEQLVDLVGLRAASPSEHALQRHVAECRVCAARLRELERVAGSLEGLRATAFELPPSLEARIAEIPAEHPSFRARMLRWRLVPIGLVATALASFAALTLVTTRSPTRESPQGFSVQQTVALLPVKSSVRGTVEFGKPSGQSRVVRLTVRGLPTRGSRAFDLWFVSATGAMRAGSFGPDKDGACQVDLTTPRDERWDRITITPSGQAPDASVLASS